MKVKIHPTLGGNNSFALNYNFNLMIMIINSMPRHWYPNQILSTTKKSNWDLWKFLAASTAHALSYPYALVFFYYHPFTRNVLFKNAFWLFLDSLTSCSSQTTRSYQRTGHIVSYRINFNIIYYINNLLIVDMIKVSLIVLKFDI